jgi:hypothetical protein
MRIIQLKDIILHYIEVHTIIPLIPDQRKDKRQKNESQHATFRYPALKRCPESGYVPKLSGRQLKEPNKSKTKQRTAVEEHSFFTKKSMR